MSSMTGQVQGKMGGTTLGSWRASKGRRSSCVTDSIKKLSHELLGHLTAEPPEQKSKTRRMTGEFYQTFK